MARQSSDPSSPPTEAPVQAKLEIAADPSAGEKVPMTGGGSALPDDVREQMEYAFGANFSAVRVESHSRHATRLRARALAVGNRLHFAPGAYEPNSRAGRALIGHELAHVVQQRQGRVPGLPPKGAGLTIDAALEREADEAGERAARGALTGLGDGPGASPAIQPMLMLRFTDELHMAATGIRDMFPHLLQPGLRGRDSRNDDEFDLVEVTSDGGFLVKRVADEVPILYAPDGDHFEVLPATHEDLARALAESTVDEPLDPVLLDYAEIVIERLHGERGERRTTGRLRELLSTGRKHRSDYDAQFVRTEPRARRRRREEAPSTVRTFDRNDAESDTSDNEIDADARLERAPLAWSATANHSHGFSDGTWADAPAFERRYTTGLPYADTYAAFLKGGGLVPRQINQVPNVGGHRRPMRQVEARLQEMSADRDALFAELDRLRARAQSQHGRELRGTTEAIDKVVDEIRDLLARRARPHIEGVMFGSSLRITEDDVAASAANREARTRLHRGFFENRDDTSSIAALARQRAPAGLLRPSDTDTHAEQTIVNSRAWMATLGGLKEAILRYRDEPSRLLNVAEAQIDLFINRTTCLGCGKELALELARFWGEVATAMGWKDWREAKDQLSPYVRFRIQTPAIYQRLQEDSHQFANLRGILQGLRDAGWQVVITQGIVADESARERNEAARRIVEGRAGRGGGGGAAGAAAASLGDDDSP